jgi:hypothetical protein
LVAIQNAGGFTLRLVVRHRFRVSLWADDLDLGAAVIVWAVRDLEKPTRAGAESVRFASPRQT